MGHNLYFGMYTFNIKKSRTSNDNLIENNQFLSEAYYNVEGSKFAEGFAQDVIKLIDQKTFKNSRNTHGGVLEDKRFNGTNRTLDLMINGGITGIKQYIIEEDGEKTELSDKTTIGLKFFGRIWLPANTETGYVFLQKYGSLSIKPLFDEIIKQIYEKHGYGIVGYNMKAATTKKRQEEFLKKSLLRDLVVVSKSSRFDTAAPNSTSATIRIKNVKIDKKSRSISNKDVNKILKDHGFKIGNRNYMMKATYENSSADQKEEKTVVLDNSEETINVVPNIWVPDDCIDVDNHPIFDKMCELADQERAQVMIESKMK